MTLNDILSMTTTVSVRTYRDAEDFWVAELILWGDPTPERTTFRSRISRYRAMSYVFEYLANEFSDIHLTTKVD